MDGYTQAYLARGVHPLYAITAFVCAVIVFILITQLKSGREMKRNSRHDLLFFWVLFFCIQDGVWGLFASHVIKNDTGLFLISAIFHLSAAATTIFWVLYMLSYLGQQIRMPKLYKTIVIALFTLQAGMIAANFFNNFLFYIDEYGFYTTTVYRKILFYLQFAVYIVVTAVTFIIMLIKNANDENRRDWISAFCVNLAPFIFSIFQMIYPDAPADSIGFAIGCVIVHSFLTTDYQKQASLLQEKEQLQLALEEALTKAQASDNAKTTFLFNMSHDIRTPMNAILGFADIAERHIDEKPRVLDSVEKIKKSGSQLLNLVNDILEMSRIESGKLDIVPVSADLRDTLDGIVPMLQSLAIEKSIDFSVNSDGVADSRVSVDVNHLNQVLVNLITNSIKYTNDGGKVRMTMEQLSAPSEETGTADYRFTVSDTGIGMSEQFMEHMFEQFSRERTSTVTKQQGTGLGLAIVKRIVDAMHGTIRVSSKEGEGSAFTVVLPMRILTSEEITEMNTVPVPDEVPGKPESPHDFSGMKVLLVDDNEMNREIAVEILEEEGFVVETAEDGAIAVETVKEHGIPYFDFILMDIQMPVMNGYEATREIRQLPNGGTVPIIALSANAFEEDKQHSIEAGMNAHLSKPVNIPGLLSTLAEFSIKPHNEL